jgi:16S rRNA (cytosine967-C5)-methyltransferase
MRLNWIYPINCNGAALPFTGCFDKVLLDAPCSGTGVLHRHPEGRWLKKPEDIQACARIQKDLFEKVAPFVAVGGVMVYATCSLEPEENGSQVASFLERHTEFVLDPPAREVKETYLDDNGYLSITPQQHGLDGMFAARLRRKS